MKLQYLAILHKDADSAYGITLPDFPGCISASDDWNSIAQNLQESVELWAEDLKDFVPPTASSLEDIKTQIEDDGILYIAEIDFSFLNIKIVPVNISMPLYMKTRIDKAAKDKSMNRSNYLIKAAEEYGA